MHNDWMRLVAGRLESRYRYSTKVVYNTFPWPDVTDAQRKSLIVLAKTVLLTRENYPENTLAELYDPLKMPADLLKLIRLWIKLLIVSIVTNPSGTPLSV